MPAVVTKISRQNLDLDWIVPYTDDTVTPWFTPKEIERLHQPAIKELELLLGFKNITINYVGDTVAEIRYNFDTLANTRNAYPEIASPPKESARFLRNQRVENLVRAKKAMYSQVVITEH